VVLVARLLWDKGIGEFVEAARILRLRGAKARFVIVGDPDFDNRACINSMTLEAWKTEGVIELWGFRSDIADVLTEANIACLPSYREGLPKSLLEAMAAGLPCITTDVPGCREAVRDGDNGLLVPAKDASALANAIEHLLLNPDVAQIMGTRGRERLEQEFSSRQVNEKTLTLYRELLSK
jgi:glycosyltransferase involved in cell wall biosynthesis